MRRQRPPAASWIDSLVEDRVARAQAEGQFDDLPGAGKPLDLDDDRLVPEELRMAYRILRNAGFVPPEVQALKDIGELERLVHASVDAAARRRALARLNLLFARMAAARAASGGSLQLDEAYYRQVVDRFLADRDDQSSSG
jgi:hypothetical protein